MIQASVHVPASHSIRLCMPGSMQQWSAVAAVDAHSPPFRSCTQSQKPKHYQRVKNAAHLTQKELHA